MTKTIVLPCKNRTIHSEKSRGKRDCACTA